MIGAIRIRAKKCNYCQKQFTGKISRCSKCKEALYCSRECQRKDWPQHRKFCTTYVCPFANKLFFFVFRSYLLTMNERITEGVDEINQKGLVGGLGEARSILEVNSQVLIKKHRIIEVAEQFREEGEDLHSRACRLSTRSGIETCVPVQWTVFWGLKDMTKLFLEFCPESACELSTGQRNLTALHTALLLKDYDMIQIIMEYCPQAAQVLDDDNYLPIHHGLMIDPGPRPQLVMLLNMLKKSNYYGLFHPFNNANEPIWNNAPTSWQEMYFHVKTKLDNGVEHSSTTVEHLFYLFDDKPAGEVYPYIIHESIGKIPYMFYMALLQSKFRINVNLKDDKGNTALMIAIQKASEPNNHQYWSDYYSDVIRIIFQASCAYSRNKNYPDSDIYSKTKLYHLRDGDGRYLLHIAAEEGLPWFGIQEILDGNADTIIDPDGGDQSGLLPFMLASDLSSSFELFRNKPDVLVSLGLEML